MKLELRKVINIEKINNLKNGILNDLFIDMVYKPFLICLFGFLLKGNTRHEIISSNLEVNKYYSISMDI